MVKKDKNKDNVVKATKKKSKISYIIVALIAGGLTYAGTIYVPKVMPKAKEAVKAFFADNNDDNGDDVEATE